MKKDTVYLTMLLDYYGDLLTDKQKEYFDLHYNQDLTLAEIGEMNGISRQGVWEIVRRAEAAMRAIDERTGLVARYNERREAVRSIRALLTPLAFARGAQGARQLTEVTHWRLRACPKSFPRRSSVCAARAA